MKHVLLAGGALAAAGFVGSALAAEADLPPNAQPGKCYGRMLSPEVYEDYTEQVVATPATVKLTVIPAVVEEREERVLASEARSEFTTIPATYKTVTETVTVKAASVRTETVPAIYETVTEQVLVREAHTVWKRGAPGPHDVVVPGSTKWLPTGEVLCLVEVPAEYRTVTRQVLRQPETTRQIPVAAETAVVTHEVIDQPARVVERKVDATYKTIRVKVVTRAERTEEVQIPATYKTITKQRMVSPGRFEWREVSCRPEAGPPPAPAYAPPPPMPARPLPPPPPAHHRRAPAVAPAATTSTYTYTRTTTNYAAPVGRGDSTIYAMQSALAQRGYYKGPLDGLFTPLSVDALHRFQRDKGLAVGSLTGESAAALGLR